MSPIVMAGRFLVLGLFLGSRLWVEQAVEASAPALTVVGLAVAALLVVGVGTFAYASLAWRYNVYRTTADGVELRTGVVFRSTRQLPFDRIEAIDTAQPLVPRLLGLAEVRIEAISAQGNEMRMRYLASSEAAVLRDELLARRASVAPERPRPPPAQGALLLAVPPAELVVAYLVLPLALGVTAVVLALAALGWAVGWEGAVAGGFVAVLAAVSVVIPAALRLERLWGFQLTDAGDALIVRRGMINLNTQRIATGRVQSLRVDQPLPWRLLDRYRVVVDVAGYRGAGSDEAAAAATLLPVASPQVVRDLMERLEVRADLESLRFEPVPSRVRLRSLRWRSLRLACTDSHVVVRSGVLWRKTTVASRRRLQSARVIQGPWQRRLRLATVRFDTAGARIPIVALHRDQHEAVRVADDLTASVVG